MTIRQSQLIAPVQVAGVATTYLTTPANTTYRLGRTAFSNPTAGAVTVTVYVVAPAGAPSAANEVIDAQSIAPGSTYVSPELAGLVLPAGWTLQALASAAASIVLYSSGVSIQ